MRPFDVSRFIDALPSTTQTIVVLDRTKEPGSIGEPLYLDVLAAPAEGWPARANTTSERTSLPHVIGGRHGLSSKEFTPAMVKSIFAELQSESPKRHFTIGIHDDVSLLSLPWDEDNHREPDEVVRAVFYGLGSDGTVGANKNSVKIIGEETDGKRLSIATLPPLTPRSPDCTPSPSPRTRPAKLRCGPVSRRTHPISSHESPA